MMYSYTMHTHSLFCLWCVGTCKTMSTSIEHELTKRAFESIIMVSSRSNPALIPFPCFASNMLNTFSSLWFSCKHVEHVSDSLIWMIKWFCVATKMMKNCSFQCFVCSLHDNFEICVAILMLNSCSFQCMMCTYIGDILDMFPFVSLPNPPLVASRMLTTCSFKCLICNNP